MDQEKILFHSKMMRVAKELGVAVESGGESYRDAVYARWKEDGAPPATAWLRRHLASEFRWLSSPPMWVQSRTGWPFFGGHPMVFINQVSLPENDLTLASLTPRVVLYLFGARKPVDDGFELTFRVVVQPEGFASA